MTREQMPLGADEAPAMLLDMATEVQYDALPQGPEEGLLRASRSGGQTSMRSCCPAANAPFLRESVPR